MSFKTSGTCTEMSKTRHFTICNVQSNDGGSKVGTRKRARVPVGYVPGDLSDGLGTIPLERSLVLARDDSDYWSSTDAN